MVRDDHDSAESSGNSLAPSRRSVLKTAGVGGALSLLAGVGLAQQDDGTDQPTGNQTDEDTGQDSSLIADLVDPVFGYPLASEEVEGVDVDHVVTLEATDGPGIHEGFPSEPDETVPGSSVEIPFEVYFDPAGLAVTPGDVVLFENVSELHTVTAYHEKFSESYLEIPNRVPDGVPGFTAPPITAGEAWAYQFSEPGIYDMFCFPHFGLGQALRVVAFDPETDSLDDEAFQAPSNEELFDNERQVYDTDEMAPANIVDQGEVAWADLPLGTGAGTGTPADDGTPTENGTDPGTPAENQ